MDVMLGINQEFVADQSAVNRITNELFPKELQELARIAETLK